MDFIFFGGDGHFVNLAQIELSALGHGLEIVSNTGIDLVRWMQTYGMPDAVFFGQDSDFPNNEYLIPVMKKVHTAHPDLHLVYVNIGLPPMALHREPTLQAIYALGVPIYTFMCDPEDHEQLVNLATTKWPGFNPKHGFMPTVVRSLPDTKA
ncbi:MAG: hypothetical protein UT91_C0021G0007 [Parcubacteria group bacterium GW2011_GWA2_40_23]|nr:MAG: hypothetical protein UT91_C0021G0007 [Parcubacteria group bacterium GW2011_GWA2_40_23]